MENVHNIFQLEGKNYLRGIIYLSYTQEKYNLSAVVNYDSEQLSEVSKETALLAQRRLNLCHRSSL